MSNIVPLSKPRTRRVPELLQLKIELAWIKPLIWRRVVVPESITLPKLHQVIQVAMGWMACHLHEFEIAGEHYGIPDPDFEWGEPVRSEQRVRLGTALGAAKSFRYTYDFGDDWEHRIKIEKRLPPIPNWPSARSALPVRMPARRKMSVVSRVWQTSSPQCPIRNIPSVRT